MLKIKSIEEKELLKSGSFSDLLKHNGLNMDDISHIYKKNIYDNGEVSDVNIEIVLKDRTRIKTQLSNIRPKPSGELYFVPPVKNGDTRVIQDVSISPDSTQKIFTEEKNIFDTLYLHKDDKLYEFRLDNPEKTGVCGSIFHIPKNSDLNLRNLFIAQTADMYKNNFLFDLKNNMVYFNPHCFKQDNQIAIITAIYSRASTYSRDKSIEGTYCLKYELKNGDYEQISNIKIHHNPMDNYYKIDGTESDFIEIQADNMYIQGSQLIKLQNMTDIFTQETVEFPFYQDNAYAYYNPRMGIFLDENTITDAHGSIIAERGKDFFLPNTLYGGEEDEFYKIEQNVFDRRESWEKIYAFAIIGDRIYPATEVYKEGDCSYDKDVSLDFSYIKNTSQEGGQYNDIAINIQFVRSLEHERFGKVFVMAAENNSHSTELIVATENFSGKIKEYNMPMHNGRLQNIVRKFLTYDNINDFLMKNANNITNNQKETIKL